MGRNKKKPVEMGETLFETQITLQEPDHVSEVGCMCGVCNPAYKGKRWQIEVGLSDLAARLDWQEAGFRLVILQKEGEDKGVITMHSNYDDVRLEERYEDKSYVGDFNALTQPFVIFMSREGNPQIRYLLKFSEHTKSFRTAPLKKGVTIKLVVGLPKT